MLQILLLLGLLGLVDGSYHLRHRELAQRRMPPSGRGDGNGDKQYDNTLKTGGSGPHPPLEIVEDEGFNRVGSVRPLQLCQGDCSTNDDCANGLVCFKRNNEFSPEEVPGCDGAARGNADYCVEAKYAQAFDALTFTGHFGPFGECGGDCDSDEDCMGDLVCYQQGGHTDSDDDVPGCNGKALGNTDYCVDNNRLMNSGKFVHFTKQGENNLGRCEGDCDNDSDCKEGLVCFERNGGGGDVPGCEGIPVMNVDYCVDGPPPPTPRPTLRPLPEIKESEDDEGKEEDPDGVSGDEESKEEGKEDDKEGEEEGPDDDADGVSESKDTEPEPEPEEPTVPLPTPSPTEPAAPTTDSPDDPEDYPFSVFVSAAIVKEPEDVAAVSETGEEEGTEVPLSEDGVDGQVPIVEGRQSPQSNSYTDLSNTVSQVFNILFDYKGYDIINAAASNRRLVTLNHDGVTSQVVPVTSSAQGAAPYEWVAFKAEYTVTDFSPDGQGQGRRTQDSEQLTGEEVEEDMKGIVSEAIADGSLLEMLQRRAPNVVLGVSEFGAESTTDVDTSSVPDQAPAASTRDTEPGVSSSRAAWWVWLLVALAGFTLLVLTVFAIKRRNKNRSTVATSTRSVQFDGGKDAIIGVAPTFDNEDSDDEQPHWGDGSKLDDLSNRFGAHPFDETSGSEFEDEIVPPPPPDLPKDSVLYREHPELFVAANSSQMDTVEL